MLQRLLTFYRNKARVFCRNKARVAHVRERAFLDLLYRVLRELANPPAPSGLAQRIQNRGTANLANNRSFPMKIVASTNPAPSMFTPLDSAGGREMSRASVTVAVLVNVAILLLLGIQVRAHVIAAPPRVVGVFAPVEKLPEPPQPKVRPRIDRPKPVPVREDTPKIVRTAAVPVEAPAPMRVVQPKGLPMVAPAMARVEVMPIAPRPQPVQMQTSPVAVQPVGPAVSAVNFRTAPASASATGSAISDVKLGGHGPVSGSAHLASVSAVDIGGCLADCGRSRGTAPPARLEPIALVRPVQAMPPTVMVEHKTTRTPPQVLFKPRPVYTPDATALHIEGTVAVRIRVSADGSVSVLGVQSGLGHGLDESAVRCAQGIRFRPAVDANGAATDWEGVVAITFQMA